MDTNLLQDFIVLSKTKNFTLASQNRFITQSAFSRRIQKLETWAETKLIIRHKSTITLTPAGKSLLKNAHKVIDQMKHTKSTLDNYKNSTENKVSISSQNTIIRHFLPHWINTIEKHTGEVYWSLQSEKMSLSIKSFLSQKIDFLFCYKNNDIMHKLDADIHDYTPVGKEILVPVVNASGKYAKRTLPNDKNNPIPFLAYNSDSFFGTQLNAHIKMQCPKLYLNTKFDHHYSHILYDMVIQDRGMAWLPISSIKDDLNNNTLKIIGSKNWYLNLDIILCSYKNYPTDLYEKIATFSKVATQ